MKKLLVGEIDEELLPQVKEEILAINRRRLQILIGVLFFFQLFRELFSLLFENRFLVFMGRPFSFPHIIELGVLVIFFLLLTFVSKKPLVTYLFFHLFLGFWVFSMLFSLLGMPPESSGYTAALTVFVNVMLINLFFQIYPFLATGLNILLFSALIYFEYRSGTVSGFLLFSVFSTVILLAFANIHLYRTTFFQVYYRIKNHKQVERIREQNIELDAQNAEIHAQRESLEETLERMKSFITNVPGVVYRSKYDTEWTMVFISRRIEELCGWANGLFQSGRKTYGEIILSEDRKMVDETIRTAVDQHKPFTVEYRINTKSGKVKWVREYGQGIYDRDGSVKWLDGVIVDIDEEKRMARLREDVERTVRHDLKNPLNGIIGFSSILLENDTLDDEEKEFLSLIKQSGYKMLHMINNSLDLFKMEEGNYNFTPEKCDILSIINQVMLEKSENLPGKKLAFELKLDEKNVTGETVLPIHGEKYNLESLFANLLSNAVEASPPGGKITVTITSGDPVTIAMHNDGAVPKDIRETFFSRYSTSGKKQGTGIGTYSARLIARVHGGDITFTTSEDEGTTLFVTLPLNR